MALVVESKVIFTVTSTWTAGFQGRFVKGWAIGSAVGLPKSLLVIPFV